MTPGTIGLGTGHHWGSTYDEVTNHYTKAAWWDVVVGEDCCTLCPVVNIQLAHQMYHHEATLSRCGCKPTLPCYPVLSINPAFCSCTFSCRTFVVLSPRWRRFKGMDAASCGWLGCMSVSDILYEGFHFMIGCYYRFTIKYNRRLINHIRRYFRVGLSPPPCK